MLGLWEIKKIEKRILDIERELKDPTRWREFIGTGITTDAAEKILKSKNQPLIDELEEQKIKRNFVHDQRATTLTILAMAISLGIVFLAPWWQHKNVQEDSIQSIYQTIDANQDIFINNFNELKLASNNGQPLDLPESFIEIPLDGDAFKKIQRKLGIDQYRFFLVYLNQTKLMNEEIQQLRREMIAKGTISSTSSQEIRAYKATLIALEEDSHSDAKFNYIHDTACLQYLFANSFSFLTISERDQTTTCSTESLNRLFARYGYIEAEVPSWLRPELRAALNERHLGLGDSLIHDEQYGFTNAYGEYIRVLKQILLLVLFFP